MLVLQSFDERYVRSLLRWRWLALALSALAILLIEGAEGLRFDVHAWIEVLLFGLIIPSTTWLLVTILARHITRRVDIERRLEQHRRLTQQLSQHQEWDELTKFVTQFPGTFLPVDQATLFTYDHRKARLMFVSDWNVRAGAISPAPSSPSFDICQTCPLAKSPKMGQAAMCASAQSPNGDQPTAELCLPLGCNRLLVGILRLRCQPGWTLTQDQIEFMNSISSEVALALVLSIAYPRQMTQARVEAQLDERRRIAYELHNSLAQQASYLHLSLDRLISEDGMFESEAARQELERIREVANDVYEQIRNNLPILRSWGQADLTQAIAERAHVVARIAGVEIDLRTEGKPTPLPPLLNQRISSLVREGLNNIERHARAQHMQIVLGWSADSLSIDMVDDGIGFDPSSVPEGHYGLEMMREQAGQLYGEFNIDSVRGRGTRLSFRIPLPVFQTMSGSGRSDRPDS